MPLDFPASPTNGQYYNGFVYNSANEVWDSAYAPRPATIPISSPNYVINGGFDIWQRGTSTTTTAAGYRTADRWATWISAGTGTIQQDTTYPAPGCENGIRFTSSAPSSSVVYYHTIETKDAIRLAGKTVTLSAYIASPSGKSVQLSIWSSTSVDNSFTGAWDAVSSVIVTGTSSVSRYTLTGTIPANAKTIQIRMFSSVINSTEFFSFSGVQLEEGAAATDFRRNAPSIQAELAACQRYYYRKVGDSSNGYFGNAIAYTSTALQLFIQMPVSMRIRPALSEYGGTFGAYIGGSYEGSISSLGNIDGAANKETGCVSVGGSGFTVTRNSQLLALGGTSYMGFSAEL